MNLLTTLKKHTQHCHPERSEGSQRLEKCFMYEIPPRASGRTHGVARYARNDDLFLFSGW